MLNKIFKFDNLYNLFHISSSHDSHFIILCFASHFLISCFASHCSMEGPDCSPENMSISDRELLNQGVSNTLTALTSRVKDMHDLLLNPPKVLCFDSHFVKHINTCFPVHFFNYLFPISLFLFLLHIV